MNETTEIIVLLNNIQDKLDLLFVLCFAAGATLGGVISLLFRK